MEQLIEQAKQLKERDLQLEPLGQFLEQFDFADIDYSPYKPEVKAPDNYARNVVLMDPLEIAILYWPPGTESAIHFHEGFWGYVAVLEGEGENIEYEFDGEKLVEQKGQRYVKGGMFGEQDKVIHKITNPQQADPLLTAHFYYPPLESFDGMKIFDIENERIGVLSDDAETASWKEDEENFKEIKENAFTFVPFKKK
jgi:predicted metal-dependent enzyme (double-stranded beta helix superfamily)